VLFNTLVLAPVIQIAKKTPGINAGVGKRLWTSFEHSWENSYGFINPFVKEE